MKGVREVELRPTGKPDLIKITARAFVVRVDQMDSNEWFTAESLSKDEGDQGGDTAEDNFLSILQKVSRRRSTPSAPDPEGSGTSG